MSNTSPSEQVRSNPYFLCEHIKGFANANYCRSCNLEMCDACAVKHKSHLPSEPIPTSSKPFDVTVLRKRADLIEWLWANMKDIRPIVERIETLEAALRKIRVDCFDDSEWAQIIDSALSGKP